MTCDDLELLWSSKIEIMFLVLSLPKATHKEQKVKFMKFANCELGVTTLCWQDPGWSMEWFMNTWWALERRNSKESPFLILFSNSFKSSSTKGLGHSTLNWEHLVYKKQDPRIVVKH